MNRRSMFQLSIFAVAALLSWTAEAQPPPPRQFQIVTNDGAGNVTALEPLYSTLFEASDAGEKWLVSMLANNPASQASFTILQLNPGPPGKYNPIPQ